MTMYTKLPFSVYSGNVNENLTTLYDMVTEMAHELKTVSKSLEETKGKLNETEKELKDVTEELADVTEELRETKRQLNATEKKLNTGEDTYSLREGNVFSRLSTVGSQCHPRHIQTYSHGISPPP